MANTLASRHFQLLPFHGVSHLGIVPDTSTLAAHDFDVDVQTGFMPPQPPLRRLPELYDPWECLLDAATVQRLKLGESDLTEQERKESEAWRRTVQELSVLPTQELTTSEVILRRAHHVLTFMLHFYIHTQPPTLASCPIHIPPPLSVPLLQVCANLELPPVLTYSDNVLYNWELSIPQAPFSSAINPAHLRIQSTFTGTPDEEHFYLTSSQIELAGVSALSLLRSVHHEAFAGDLLSLRRISGHLTQLVTIIDTMTTILNNVRKGCDPAVFYNKIRPWFRGQGTRPWIFQGAEDAGLPQPIELSGSSAGQSSLIHVLDIILGIDQFSHTDTGGTTSVPYFSPRALENKESSFLERMESYMPRHHRAFLTHLKSNPRPLRAIVMAKGSPTSTEERKIRKDLKEAYNASVTAVKRFRDAHIRIATLYIVNQARRIHDPQGGQEIHKHSQERVHGTGGSDLVPFLRGVRDRTVAAILDSDEYLEGTWTLRTARAHKSGASPDEELL
ncbi:Indoleamine 2,3-dioxygenase [Ramaria rubella]|nr:Indoleamine 2,3-dioxygenase [Ramaria rubella]